MCRTQGNLLSSGLVIEAILNNAIAQDHLEHDGILRLSRDSRCGIRHTTNRCSNGLRLQAQPFFPIWVIQRHGARASFLSAQTFALRPLNRGFWHPSYQVRACAKSIFVPCAPILSRGVPANASRVGVWQRPQRECVGRVIISSRSIRFSQTKRKHV